MAPWVVPICMSRSRHPDNNARLDAVVGPSSQQSLELSRYRCLELDSALRLCGEARCREVAAIRLVLFPEGTSSDGSTVLPFKSALLESAVQLRSPIAAASIEYALDDGSVAEEVCYWRDMTLVPHLLNLLCKREIGANYSFSPAKVRAGNRKEIARELRDEIVSIRS